MENFYQTLGVSETASQDEIKKAYRKLAVQHHPDKGGDEDTFKKISEAYDTIGDENKRRQYDGQRSNPFSNMGGGGFNPFEDMFQNHFHQQRRRSAPDKIIEVNIGVIESYNGSEKTFTYNRKHKCEPCNGQGGERVNCTTCGGEGFITQRVGSGLFVQLVRQTCNSCAGKGFSYKTKCGVCNGETTNSKSETITIKLPHGIDEGQFLKLQGKGDYVNGVYGNLVIRVKVMPESNFEKSGDDLIYNAYFDLDSLKNEKLDVKHPKGTMSIKLPEEFDTEKPLRVKSKGFHNTGDLFIKLHVKFKRN